MPPRKLRRRIPRPRLAGEPSSREAGQCEQALPLLAKSASRLADKQLKKQVGFYGLRCAMAMNQMDPALDFIRMLQHEFPGDPEVLYLSVHVFSDLSIKASQALLFTAPALIRCMS